MSGGLIQTPSQEVSSKLRMEHWCTQFTLCHYWLYTLWFCWPSDIPVGKHSNDNNATRHPTLWRSINLGTDITTCSHIAEIDAQAFCSRDSCKSYPFLCNTSKKRTSHMVVKMQTLRPNTSLLSISYENKTIMVINSLPYSRKIWRRI